MLTLTKKTHYALIALAYLAERRGQYCSARQIADEYAVPLPVLMNILKTLQHEDLVESTRGAKGGYRLAVDPEQMSLARLIEAVEGPVRIIQCLDAEGKKATCSLSGDCPIRGPVIRLHQKLNSFLQNAMLAEVIADGGDGPNGRDGPGGPAESADPRAKP